MEARRGVGRPDRRRRAGAPVRRLPHARDDRGRAGAGVRDLEAGDLREPPGAAGERRVAGRLEPVEERLLELGAGEGEDHRPVPEGHDGERLAPGDLAGPLAGRRGDAEEVGPEAAGRRTSVNRSRPKTAAVLIPPSDPSPCLGAGFETRGV